MTERTNDVPVEDGWIQWTGGECPVQADASVELWFGCGDCLGGEPAGHWDWNETGSHGIIAYRVVAA